MGDHATGYSEKDSSFRAPPVGKLGILPGDPIPQPPMSDVVRGYILNLIVNYSSVSCKMVTLLHPPSEVVTSPSRKGLVVL